MTKFKTPSEVNKFISGAKTPVKYPWDSAFIRDNPEITKTFSISMHLEYYMKLEWYQNFLGERSKNQVIRDILYKAIDTEVEKIIKSGVKTE